MDKADSTAPPRVRMTNAQRKTQTREAVVISALDVFTRDGYHAASLETIAAQAGYSKGAIYSNFEGKAGLFLAVMDFTMENLLAEDFDLFNPPGHAGHDRDGGQSVSQQEAAAYVEGFGLATLEFITVAARDHKLLVPLRQRVDVLTEKYRQIAAAESRDDDPLPAGDLAYLMLALDQGAGLMSFSGVSPVPSALIRSGLRRLIDPRQAADEPAPDSEQRTTYQPEAARVQRMIADMPHQPAEAGEHEPHN